MARLIGPDESVRLVYTTGGLAKAQGFTGTVYADSAGTQLADILTVGGAAIPGSVVTVDAYSKIPLFQFPNGVDTVYITVNGGPIVPLYAREDDRLDSIEARVTALEPGGAAAAVPATRTITAGTGLTGGGDLTANRSFVVAYGTTAGTAAQGNDSRITGALQAANNLSDVAAAATARTNLGVAYGSTAGTVAQGNDSRLSDARTPTAHASTHASAGSDPVSLNGSQITAGTVATARLSVGTTTGTVAAGDDSRITGAAQKASNLSDLASAATARTNLGVAYGTTTGTVAQGDDSRITGAAQKSANLSDLASASTARTNLGAKAPDVQVFTASGTWTKPAGAVAVHVGIVGGGAGGGSGRRGAAGTVRGGGGGGSCGTVNVVMFRASDLGASVTVTVGAGGTGGSAVGADDTNGSAGAAGGPSNFGGILYGLGGLAGGGGLSGSGGAAGASNLAGSGGAGAAGGTGAGLGTNAPAPLTGMGGGGGGGITSGDVPGNGGTYNFYPPIGLSGGSGGTVGGAGPLNGPSASVPMAIGGGGGGGGAASITGAAQAGGNGGSYGGGGGGGGASLNGNASGAGGTGGPGIVVVTTYF